MSIFNGDWTGKILGTNNADIFVEIVESNGSLQGTVRINDPLYGTSVYTYTGNSEASTFHLEMDPTPSSNMQNRTHTALVNGRRVTVQTEGVNLGHVTVEGNLVEIDRVEGKWISSTGTGGTFWIKKAVTSVETASKFEGDIMDNVAFIMMSISSGDPSLEDSLNAIKRAMK